MEEANEKNGDKKTAAGVLTVTEKASAVSLATMSNIIEIFEPITM